MKSTNSVTTCTAMQLNDPIFDSRLWLVARNEPMSRRAFIDAIAENIYDFVRDGGSVLCGESGRPWPVPDVYTVMGEDGRWLSLWFKEIEGRPVHRPSPATLERRRLIDLYYQICYPGIAKKLRL